MTYFVIRAFTDIGPDRFYGEFSQEIFAITVPLGDVNGSCAVDIDDAILALQIVAGVVPTVSVYLEAEATGDGRIGSEDAIWIIQEIAGLHPGPYPESEHPYANDTDRTWAYTLPGNPAWIAVTFDPLTYVEEGWDYIHVMDGGGNPIEGSPFTGTALAGQTKIVPGPTVQIRLQSDFSVTDWGFRVTDIRGFAY